MSTATEASMLERLDFELSTPCEWCAVQGLEAADAAYYLRRPSCPCHPEGYVFPACEGWGPRHAPGGGARHRPCGAVFYTAEYVVVETL